MDIPCTVLQYCHNAMAVWLRTALQEFGATQNQISWLGSSKVQCYWESEQDSRVVKTSVNTAFSLS